MKARQYLLLKLSEECAEVAQRACKQSLHGPFEVQPEQTATNATRLRSELLDLHMWEAALVAAGEIAAISENDVLAHAKAKYPKLMKYRDMAIAAGNLDL